jgi:uncharacterized membrane protein YfcA
MDWQWPVGALCAFSTPGALMRFGLTQGGAIAPEWILGAFLGAGGFAGSYCGARLQSLLPERSLRRLLGLIACLVAARYFQTAATERSVPRAASHGAPA